MSIDEHDNTTHGSMQGYGDLQDLQPHELAAAHDQAAGDTSGSSGSGGSGGVKGKKGKGHKGQGPGQGGLLGGVDKAMRQLMHQRQTGSQSSTTGTQYAPPTVGMPGGPAAAPNPLLIVGVLGGAAFVGYLIWKHGKKKHEAPGE